MSALPRPLELEREDPPAPGPDRPRSPAGGLRRDALVRVLPFSAVVAVAAAALGRPPWLGLAWGEVAAQLAFGLAAGGLLFTGAAALRVRLAARGGRRLEAFPGAGMAVILVAYFALNAIVEEALFRGLVQGGVGAALAAPAGIAIATPLYAGYHRLGGWRWLDVAGTGLAGLVFAFGFWLLPGPASLLGVAIAHFAATCGFLGPGAWLAGRLR